MVREQSLRFRMGTFIQIEVAAKTQSHAEASIDAAFLELNRIEKALSRYQEGSVISQINRHAHRKPMTIDNEWVNLICDAKAYTRLTQGAFDITSLPLTLLWTNAQKSGEVPNQDAIRNQLQYVGSDKIAINATKGSIYLKQKNMQLDMGAIGKGYAVDRAIHILLARGITGAIVNAGGNIFVMGDAPMEIGVKDAEQPDDFLFTHVSLQNQAIATSANYERPIRVGNKQFSHIIDPRSGYPVENSLTSVSIISPTAMESDVFSTASYILGHNPSSHACVMQNRAANYFSIV